MGNDKIYCFNGKECTYENGGCIFFNQTLDGCILQAWKNKQVTVTQPQPTQRTQTALPPTAKEGVRSINSLVTGEKGNKQNPLCLKGTLVLDPIQKDVDTQYGPNSVTSIILKDDTGEAKISFWGDMGDQIMNFVKGDSLSFEGLYRVKEPYDGKPQVDGGKFYTVAKLN